MHTHTHTHTLALAHICSHMHTHTFASRQSSSSSFIYVCGYLCMSLMLTCSNNAYWFTKDYRMGWHTLWCSAPFSSRVSGESLYSKRLRASKQLLPSLYSAGFCSVVLPCKCYGRYSISLAADSPRSQTLLICIWKTAPVFYMLMHYACYIYIYICIMTSRNTPRSSTCWRLGAYGPQTAKSGNNTNLSSAMFSAAGSFGPSYAYWFGFLDSS